MAYRFTRALAVVAASCTLAGCTAGKRTYVSIGAMPPGTSWYVFAATLSRLLEQRLPPGMEVEVLARGGGIGNPIVVERKQATIALAQAATAAWAYRGTSEVYNGRRCANIRAIAGGLNSVWVTAMLREDYIRETGNDTLEKALTSKKPITIVMKPAGSTVPVVADLLFQYLGTSRRQIEQNGGQIIQVDANQVPTLLRDGRADLYLETAVRGHPTVTEVTSTVDVRFVDFPDFVLKKLEGPGVKPIPMPEWFKGQHGPLQSVDMGTVLITHKDQPEDLIYLVTKLLCENKDQMARAHKAWAQFQPSEGWLLTNTGVPLHPGAERYYKERGWM
jgi:TRAP transporter TAXI family solute receptor